MPAKFSANGSEEEDSSPPPVEAPLALPVSLERFPSVPPELLSPEVWSGSGRGHLGTWLACEASAVVPFWRTWAPSGWVGGWSTAGSSHSGKEDRRGQRPENSGN